MPKSKTKQQVLGELTEAQMQELRAIDARLQEVLEERRAGGHPERTVPRGLRETRSSASREVGGRARAETKGQSKNPGAPTAEHQVGSITFRYETVRCGKDNCSRCPHGPYWYAYWKEAGRTRSRYIGRSLPAPALQSYEEKRRARLEK